MNRFGLIGVVKAWRVVALTLAVLLAGAIASPAQAFQREDPLAGLTREQIRDFKGYTRLYCQQFFRFDDRFVLLPNYKRGRDNSTGRTYDQVNDAMTQIERVSTGLGTYREIKHRPPSAEVIVAAKVIPSIDVGHYGFVNSVVVEEVVGPTEMVVKKIELIPTSEVGTTDNEVRVAAAKRQVGYAYKTYRLLGFNTNGLAPGDKYYGPRKKGLQIAVMSTDPQHAFVMVNYEQLDRIRTTEFHEALAYVQIEPLAFIDLVRANRVIHGADGNKASLISIYQRYYNRYRPKRLSQTPPAPPPTPGPETQPRPQPQDPVTVQPDPEPTPDPQPEEELEVEPEPEPVPKDPPRDSPEDEDDDWDYEEETESTPDKPTFFGIPL